MREQKLRANNLAQQRANLERRISELEGECSSLQQQVEQDTAKQEPLDARKRQYVRSVPTACFHLGCLEEHCLGCLLTQPLTHLPTHSPSLFALAHSLTHSLTHPLTHPLTHSLTHPLTHPLTHSLPSLTALSLFGVRFAQTQTYQSTATARSVSQNCTKSMLASEAAVHHTFWEQHFK